MKEIVCKKCGSLEYTIKEVPPHRQAICKHCHEFIQNLRQSDFIIWFGKFKGLRLSEFTTKEQINWLNWAVQNAKMLKDYHKELILKHLGV